MTRHQIQQRLESGRWIAVHNGVYRIAGVKNDFWVKLRAAQTWARKDYAFSHRTAARLYGFDHFVKSEHIDLTLKRSAWKLDGVNVHRRDFAEGEVQFRHQIRVTSVPLTLIDLCSLDSREDAWSSFNNALTGKLTSPNELAAYAKSAPRHDGLGLFREFVAEMLGSNGPLASELELQVYEALKTTRLPPAIKQREILIPGTKRARRVDFGLKGTEVVIEAYGYKFHSSVEDFEKDHKRTRDLVAQGVVVVPWTWNALMHTRAELLQETLDTYDLYLARNQR